MRLMNTEGLNDPVNLVTRVSLRSDNWPSMVIEICGSKSE